MEMKRFIAIELMAFVSAFAILGVASATKNFILTLLATALVFGMIYTNTHKEYQVSNHE